MTVTLLATEISGLAVQTYNSGNVNRLYVDTISSNLSNWKKGVGGIYYSGEVSIGHSTFDCGDYNFQVSGDTYLSGTVVFRGTGISGLAELELLHLMEQLRYQELKQKLYQLMIILQVQM